MSKQLLITKLSPFATLPTRATEGSVGYDLSSTEDAVVPAHGKWCVNTGVAIHMPKGVYGRIAPRSGLAWKHHIDVGAGVIDQDYTGAIKVVLFNHSETDFKISIGDRIAQLILEKCVCCDVVFSSHNSLTVRRTNRHTNGFGSTGIK